MCLAESKLQAQRGNLGAENREAAKSAKTDAKKCTGRVSPQMDTDGGWEKRKDAKT
jgi:hypothetical protein